MTTPGTPALPRLPDPDPTNASEPSRYDSRPTDGEKPAIRDDESLVIRLQIPAVARYLRLARLTGAGMASDLGFSVDALEDLRVAIDELCAALIDDTPVGTELELSYRELDGGLEIEGRCVAPTENPPVLHAVARELLSILADEYSIGAAGRERSFRLVKHGVS